MFDVYGFAFADGLQTLGEGKESAAATCVLNAVHRGTGTVWSSVVLRQSAWPHAVAGVSFTIHRLGLRTVLLRCDPEPAMETSLDGVIE